MSSSEREAGGPRRRGRPPKALSQPEAEDNMEVEDSEALLERAAGLESEEGDSLREDGEDAAEIEEPRPEDHMVYKIRARLEAARGIDASEIHVEVERGVVVLSGYVASDALRQKVVDSVSASGGVKVIRNRIRLTS